MKPYRVLLITIVFVIFAISGAAFVREETITKWSTKPNIPDTADAWRIMQTIKRAYELEARAACTFDTSEFSAVFINDPRGGPLSPSAVELVKKGLDDKLLATPGYLDYKVAYYELWERGALLWEALMAKADAEGRDLTLDERAFLIASDAAPRNCLGMEPGYLESYLNSYLNFFSISVKGDLAEVIFDDGPRTNKMTLVRVNGQWYIVGNQILSLHP